MSAKLFTTTFASGAVSSTTIDLGFAGQFETVFVNNKSTEVITLQGANSNVDTPGDFGAIYVQKDQGSAVTFATLVVATAFSGSWVPFKIAHRYLKCTAGSNVADGGTVEFSVVIHP